MDADWFIFIGVAIGVLVIHIIARWLEEEERHERDS